MTTTPAPAVGDRVRAPRLQVLRNEYRVITRGAARMIVAAWWIRPRTSTFRRRCRDPISPQGASPAPRCASCSPTTPGWRHWRARRLRPAALGPHARRAVLSVDTGSPPGPRPACRGPVAARPYVGLRERRHGYLGTAGATGNAPGADAVAPGGRALIPGSLRTPGIRWRGVTKSAPLMSPTQ